MWTLFLFSINNTACVRIGFLFFFIRYIDNHLELVLLKKQLQSLFFHYPCFSWFFLLSLFHVSLSSFSSEQIFLWNLLTRCRSLASFSWLRCAPNFVLYSNPLVSLFLDSILPFFSLPFT